MDIGQQLSQQNIRVSASGRMFYVVGASGVGKDSLMHAVCALATERDKLMIAPRMVTRANPGSDIDIELTKQAFLEHLHARTFLFNWQAHGFHYGIERNVLALLEARHDILVNGSRAYVTQARDIYPALRVIGIEAAPQQLQARLKKRGREDGADIAERLARNVQYQDELLLADAVINNAQALDLAAAEFLSLVRAENTILTS